MRRGFAVLFVVCSAAVAAPADTAAVLPFANSSVKPARGTSNLDWIGESIAETLRDAFSLRGAVTLGRDDIQEAYRRLNLRERALLTEASVIKIGETVDAEQVVYGTFEVHPRGPGAPGDSHGSLKVSARVMDRRRLRQSYEFDETGALEDLAAIEAHLAWQALDAAGARPGARRGGISFAAPSRPPGRGGELRSRVDGPDRLSSARNISRKPPAWTRASPIPVTDSARFITSARNTARPPSGWKRSVPRTSTSMRRASCWAWRAFNPAITRERRRPFRRLR